MMEDFYCSAKIKINPSIKLQAKKKHLVINFFFSQGNTKRRLSIYVLCDVITHNRILISSIKLIIISENTPQKKKNNNNSDQ